MTRTNDTYFVLPDLCSYLPYSVHLNPHEEEQGKASLEWLFKDAGFNEEEHKKFLGGNFNRLASMCYPDAEPSRLRLVMDYLNWGFALDDWNDKVSAQSFEAAIKSCFGAIQDPVNYQTDEKAGILTKSWYGRFAQAADPKLVKRCVRCLGVTMQTMNQEALDRTAGRAPNLDTYIVRRRNTSGVESYFPWHEFLGGFVLPDFVHQHAIIKSLEDASNDYSSWINDVFSYSKETGEGLEYNMVAVVMREKGLGLQEAVDYVAERCNSCVDRFERDRQQLPSWGPEVDEHVAKYVMLLQHWMTGNLYWSFESERYFGKEGLQIQKHRIIRLNKPRAQVQADDVNSRVESSVSKSSGVSLYSTICLSIVITFAYYGLFV